MKGLKICCGCFSEWEEESEKCPICGWYPEKQENQGNVVKEGWKTGDVLDKRYLLGQVYENLLEEFLVWRVYDSLMDTKCFFMLSKKNETEELVAMAWGMVQHNSEDGVVMSVKEVGQQYVLIFTMNDCLVLEENYFKRLEPQKKSPMLMISSIDYKTDQSIATALCPDTILDGRYRVVGCIGLGGFGITYLCEDILLQRNVAIKEYYPGEWVMREENYVSVKSSGYLDAYRYGMKSFLREIKMTAKFIHSEHIVTVYDAFMEHDTTYMVMEYLKGESIGKEMRKREYQPYSGLEMAEIVVPVLEALEEMHNHMMIHSDISPSNVIRLDSGKIVLLDLGATKYQLSNQPVMAAAFLKQDYAAPEQYRTAKEGIPRDEGPWTDIYAVGAVMYFLLTGQRMPDALTRLSSDNSEISLPKKCEVNADKQWFRLIEQCTMLEWKERISSSHEVAKKIDSLVMEGM